MLILKGFVNAMKLWEIIFGGACIIISALAMRSYYVERKARLSNDRNHEVVIKRQYVRDNKSFFAVINTGVSMDERDIYVMNAEQLGLPTHK